jgi:lysyl endopeptidase
MRHCSRGAWAAWSLMGACGLAQGATAPALETYRVNLNPLIDRAVQHRDQFAVDVARRVTSEINGSWRIEQDTATWTYSIRIPAAVSMAFHASRLRLPADGILEMTAPGHTYTYRGKDLRRAELWSRLAQGDQIALRMSVPAAERHQTLLEIASFQAGYRSLAPGLDDNAHYKAIKPRTAAVASAGCVENYACDASSATQSAANASVAITIGNSFECSGTLLNDVPQDGVPYVLTARHCENGQDGGGDPAAAASVAVYWNSVTPCGQTLTSIFDSFTQVQNGATTVVEQQDEWLIRLDTMPQIASAYYAGWDATGAVPVGGYSVEYANADTQQYVTWSGAAVNETQSGSSLQLGYTSNFWGVVNSLGSVDHGASGAGLFTGNTQVVGSLSRAVVAQCPASTPPTPSAASAVALYNKLAANWESTADTTSSTGTATLAATLDPGNTGTTALVGVAGPPPFAQLTVSQTNSQIGNSIVLFSSTAAGAVCTATGGANGDGWAGVINVFPSHEQVVTESQPGTVTYVLTCVSGSRSASSQVTVVWTVAPPALTFYDQDFTEGLFAGVPNRLVWASNQPSCLATGSNSADGWGGTLTGSGQISVTENQTGTFTYTVTCGSGSQSISQTLTLTFATPTASLSLPYVPANLRAGQGIGLSWTGSGSCIASGGGPGDGWGGAIAASGAIFVLEQSAGTYTYTLSCGPAANPAVANISYTFSNAPPTATLIAAQPTQLIDLPVQTFPTLLTWSANVYPCEIDYSGPVNGTLISGYLPQGTITQPQQIAGLYTYTLTCGTGAAQAVSTTTIDWAQQSTPQVTLGSVGTEFILFGGYLVWTTNVLPCVGSGGTPGDGFTGPLPLYGGPGLTSGALVTEPTAGTYRFSITCGVGNQASAQTSVVYNNAGGAQLTLSPGSSQVVTGQPVYLTWTSALAPCTGYGGTSGDGWNGPQPQQGSFALTETVGNNYTLSLVCGSGSSALEAQTSIYVTGPPTEVIAQIGGPSMPAAVGHPVTLNWNGYQAASCTASGGNPGDGWDGALPWNGSASVTESVTGSVTYALTCQNGALSDSTSTQVEWQPAPAVTLNSSTQQAVLGTPFTLTWSAMNGAFTCSATEDVATANPYWDGSLSDSGSVSVQESSGSTHTYTVTCNSSYGTVQASVTVNFTAATSGSGSSGSGSGSSGSTSSSSGSSHGGGGLDPAWLSLLAVLVALQLRKPRRIAPDH